MSDAELTTQLLQIDTMQKEYDILLGQYQEAVKTYINVISQPSTNWVSVPGRTWWGTAALSTETTSNSDECKALCSENPACSGATYNETKRYCWMRTGESKLSTGTNKDVAFITEQKEALLIMQGINDQLQKLNRDIMRKMNDVNVYVVEMNDENKQTYDQLLKSRLSLVQQREEMEVQLSQYNTVLEQESDQSSFSTQQYWLLYIWVIVLVIIVGLAIRQSTSQDNQALFIGMGLMVVMVVWWWYE